MLSLLLVFLLVISPIYGLPFNEPQPAHTKVDMGPLVRYDAPEKATASIILLHALGNSSDVFRPFPPRFYAQERFRHINFLFPNAPIRNSPYWHNWTGGQPYIRAWFNMTPTGMEWFDQGQYWGDIDYIHELVLNESTRGIPPERIIAGGFSQGGMVSLGALAGMHQKIGGWLYFSSEIPNLTKFYDHLGFENQKTSVFHGHGLNDTVIPYENAIETANRFKNLGFNYNLHLYPGMGHQTSWEPNDLDVEEWVNKIIPKKWKKGF